MESNDKRFAGNVTKSTTAAALLIGAVMTIITFALSQAGVELPADVQGAIATIITAAAVFFVGKGTKGEKANVEGAVANSIEDAFKGIEFSDLMEAIANGVAKDARVEADRNQRPAFEAMAPDAENAQ